MKKPNFLKRLFLPFFSVNYYRFVATEDKGLGLGRVMKVLTLNWFFTFIILAISMMIVFGDDDFQNHYKKILHQIPNITIQDGKASIQETTPYVIYQPETSNPLIVIDTSDRPVRDTLFYEAVIFVTKDRVEIKRNSIERRSYYFADIEDQVVTQNEIDKLLKTVLWFFVPFALAVLMVVSYIFRVLQFFIYAAIGNLFNAIFKTELTFQQLSRLTAAALTPILILDIGLFFLWGGFGLWFFNLCLAMIFLGFGVNANKNSSAEFYQ